MASGRAWIFSENGHLAAGANSPNLGVNGGSKPPPYAMMTDISPNRGITRHYAKFQCVRVGTDILVRPQNGRNYAGEHSSPLRTQYILNSRFAVAFFEIL